MIHLLKKPGLFITGTDTEVGKTVVTCAIAHALHQEGIRVGVCKPYASGCRREREELVSEDAEALAHFSDFRLPLHIINPIRYHAPLAPAVASERESGEGDEDGLREALQRIEKESNYILIEGIGGILVPLNNSRTLLDLMRDVDYPVVVVTRPDLGTLNHTAMSCRLIRRAGLRIAGLVVNRYQPDAKDPVQETNLRWLVRQNATPLLATIPETDGVKPHKGILPQAVLDAVRSSHWRDICKSPQRQV